jgi:hypothetical protein
MEFFIVRFLSLGFAGVNVPTELQAQGFPEHATEEPQCGSGEEGGEDLVTH